MKCEMLVLLAACLTFSVADDEEGPLHFLFSRCRQTEDDSGMGGCVRDLLRSALDRDRPKFSTGMEVGDKTIVLEPLQMPKANKSSQGRSSSKMEMTEAQLAGLSDVQLDSVLLTDTTAAAMVQFPELAGEAHGKIQYGFLPFRPKVTVKLQKPRLMVSASWSASDGELQLAAPTAKLWLEGYNITINGLTSMGRSMAKILNNKHKEIIEFMTPSLEAAVVRKINKMDQEQLNAALSWLENALS